MSKSRLEAFSDGVLAIIITIMVLEIKIPHSDSWWDLIHLLPIFSSYLISFFFIGIYWGNHHHLLHSVKHVSSGIIWANINLLFWLSLIPFSTGWMGENNFTTNTVVLYSVLLLVCGISFFFLQKAVEKNSHDAEKLKEAFKLLNKKGIASQIGYGLAIPLAFHNPMLSWILIIGVDMMWLIPDKKLEKAIKEL